MSRLRFVERTGSTNSDLAASDQASEGDWLVAAAQEQGRGRQGREWRSPGGNFHGSTIVQLRPTDPAASSLALVAGVALIRAVELAAPATGLLLKWPNDLLLGPGKLAGILLERSANKIVAGFGVNLAAAPDLPDRPTAALAPITLVSPQAFAPLLAAAFARELQRWRDDLPATIGLWLESAHPIGTALTVDGGNGELVRGEFGGLEPDGALKLRLGSGEVRVIRAADVSLG
ncbi:biotin--[acetyl-CoA-carboxylase] ligase [Sphingomonas sp. BN140010]|uniref:biotin--[biotin carboxyl-carrier protein] ligase n=1 Tax=Sphingomonas arvum TaxID=2992113 RepID=A0ABT3JE39_9SPHN|nr:biotin--[acetyl-CoA-carboxylase] ligase [Sphingomonas sp. BN140010]MCW3797334.1 biotin--[acetyl-CoA-carboxylase] ligase [Sphingomonas sp. BN140010]